MMNRYVKCPKSFPSVLVDRDRVRKKRKPTTKQPLNPWREQSVQPFFDRLESQSKSIRLHSVRYHFHYPLDAPPIIARILHEYQTVSDMNPNESPA